MGSDTMENEGKNVKSLIKLISTSTIIASMCCLPSVVLVLLGLAIGRRWVRMVSAHNGGHRITVRHRWLVLVFQKPGYMLI